jgi:hypothetical protein
MVTKSGRATLCGQPLFQWVSVLVNASRLVKASPSVGQRIAAVREHKSAFAEFWYCIGLGSVVAVVAQLPYLDGLGHQGRFSMLLWVVDEVY